MRDFVGKQGALDRMDFSYKHLATCGDSRMPCVAPCVGTHPMEPNVWTDGSYRNPGTQLAIGSFGVWHPDKDLPAIQPEECDFGSVVKPND